MNTVTIHQAKTHLSRLLRRVAAGEEIVIARGQQPIAKLVAISPVEVRDLGFDRAVLRIGEDFEAPLPNEILADFEA